jgi:hypothetical protein
MTKADFVRPVWRSFLTACIALAAATTASAAPSAVSALPQELWGKECFGPAPSLQFPGTMWYILLRVGADGKTVETWTTYGAPGAETKQSVATKGFESRGTLLASWGDRTYIVPVRSPKASLSLFVTLIGNNQVEYTTTMGVTGKGDCEKLP